MQINDITRNNIRENTPVRVFIIQNTSKPFIGKNKNEDSFRLVGHSLKGIYRDYFIDVEENKDLEDTLEVFNYNAYKIKKNYDHSKRHDPSFLADMLLARVNTKFNNWIDLYNSIINKQVYFAGFSKMLRLEMVHLAVINEITYQKIINGDYKLSDGRKLCDLECPDDELTKTLFVVNVLKDAGFLLQPFRVVHEGLNYAPFQQKIIDIEKSKMDFKIEINKSNYLLFNYSDIKKIMTDYNKNHELLLELCKPIIQDGDVLYIDKNFFDDDNYAKFSELFFLIYSLKNILGINKVNIAIDFSK